MVNPVLAGVGVAALYELLSESEPRDHNAVVADVYNRLDEAAPSNASVYADHVDAAPNPHGEVGGVEEHIPDVVVKSGVANSLIIEVETASSLESDAAEARSQLREFSTPGYRRALVVEAATSDEDSVREFVESLDGLDGEVYFVKPEDVTNLL